MSKKSIKCHQNYSRININISTKPRLRPRALAFPNPRPGQKPTEAKVLAWPGPAFFGPAWPGFWLQAGAGKSLFVIYVFRVRIALLPKSRYRFGHEPSFHLRVPPGGGWSDGTGKPNLGTILTLLLQFPTG
jgi:hypothetical protein